LTVNTVRPDTDFLNSSLVGVGGAVTVAGGTGDASDTTGVTANNDNDYAIVNLQNPPALASNQRVRAWRIRARVARTSADQHTQRVELKLRNFNNQLSASDTIAYGSTTVKEFIGPWRSNGPGNLAFTTSILNSMKADIVYRPRVNGANEWLEVRGLFYDFDYNNQPRVTAGSVAFSGMTSTSLPDVNWAYEDDDGDPQVRFRVKVFDTAVATAGGFNPDSSVAAYDSGEKTGNQTSITLTKPLISGVAYTPYVKVAQAWAGPEGPYWWSAWVAGSSATSTPTPPAAVAPTITLITTLPDYRALHVLVPGSPGGGSSNEIEIQVLEKCARLRGNFYNWAHPQIVSSGAVTVGVDGFYTRQAAFLSSLPLHTASPAGPLADVPSRMISWNPSVGAFSGLDTGQPQGLVNTDEAPPYVWNCVPGLPMRLSVWACTRSGTFVTKLHHLATNFANTTVQDTVGAQVTLNTSWQRLEVTFTPSPSSIFGRASVENVTPSTGVETLWHGWQCGPDPGAGALLQGGIGRYMPFPPDSPWVDVRTREVLAGYASGSTAYVTDHELIPGRPLIYRVRSKTVVTGLDVVGPWTYYTMYCPLVSTTLIRDPFQPDNILLSKRDGRSEEVNIADEAVFHASGRDGDPITLSDWSGGQDGSMLLAFESTNEERSIRELVKSTRPILVQWHDGGASYVQFGSRNWKHFDASSGQFSGDYIEKDRP
jgi:hypothetical protein